MCIRDRYTMEDECKIQRCISSEMAINWPTLYGQQDGRRRQVECFKKCHMVTCEKKHGAQNYQCKLNESGTPYPENYEYEPLTESFDDYKDDKAASEYVAKRNA
eukprot:TRINITY_DN1714_c0_g1_i8.p3 TRINITY_DN1714_c0_g1~~TRINITY_DN1714_c0_g1_i8.p3  ORF type:complete len:104 (-),score=21.33 TRINITY_DN1714_c0_g1_i8:81-392(-)